VFRGTQRPQRGRQLTSWRKSISPQKHEWSDLYYKKEGWGEKEKATSAEPFLIETFTR
jgi:hypothetical protein